MAAPPTVALNTPAPDFRLPATDGRTYALDDIAGKHGTVIVFICNHCPYVKAVINRLVADARGLQAEGIGFAAICSNDATAYPEDSFDNMTRFARTHAFPFPYLHDEDQSVARACGAACTPDFFGYAADRKLQYRGRLDEGRQPTPGGGAPGSGRGHAGDRGDRSGAGTAIGVDRLLYQMEDGVGNPRIGPVAAGIAPWRVPAFSEAAIKPHHAYGVAPLPAAASRRPGDLAGWRSRDGRSMPTAS